MSTILALDIGTEFVKAILAKPTKKGDLEILGVGKARQVEGNMHAGAVADIPEIVKQKNIVEIIAAERAKMGSKLRWPLHQVFVRGNDADVNKAVKRFDDVLAAQGNIKNVVYLGKEEIPDIGSDIEPVEFDEGTIFIDFNVTPEIEAEGYARELIRRIQQMRKDLKLNVEQYINCQVAAEERLVGLFGTWKDHIAGEVRAKELTFTDSPEGSEVKTWDVTGKDITIGITPIQ